MTMMESNVVPWVTVDGGFFGFASPMPYMSSRRDEGINETTPGPTPSLPSTSTSPSRVTAEDEKQDSDEEDSKSSLLLALPLEIRLQIYHYIYASTPASLDTKTSYTAGAALSAAYLQAVIPGLIIASPSLPTSQYETAPVLKPSASAPDRQAHPRLLDAHRRLHALPTALLLACRQIYAEARALPFAHNEFAFASSFSSGAQAALAFSRRLAGWQLSALRWARIEVPERGLMPGRGGELEELEEICGLWAEGVRGLRMRVECEPLRTVRGKDGLRAVGGGGKGVVEEREGTGLSLENVSADGEGRSWVAGGLGRLKALRQLEVELVGSKWSDEEKVEWCSGLGVEVNMGRSEGEKVAVVCVEMVCKRQNLAQFGESVGTTRIPGLEELEDDLMSW